ncbi:MAG: lysophospholipid acyltransferase family protein [Gammaproteobacteria bacterium]
MHRFFKAPLALAYGIYAWIAFVAIAVLALASALLVPGLERRRATVSALARTFLRLAGMPLAVRHAERIPPGQCVIVANHASYLDGPVFTAVLPPRFGFVIKREMSRVPLAGALLARIGSQFVERFDRHRGAADARRVLRSAVNGHSLVFFPEGTFSHQPGLLKFHTGAFATAARAGCPVVPAVVRGTRSALPSRSLLPRPGAIEIEFLPPIMAAAESADKAAVELRDRARNAILRELKEPDLSAAA